MSNRRKLRLADQDPAWTHHQALLAHKDAELHQIAREYWQTHGRGILIVEPDDGGHRLIYLTEEAHRANVANGLFEDGEAECIGHYLGLYTDPERGFPVIMYHDDDDDGTVTGMMVRPVRGGNHGQG
jgi:hypothetical protein